MKFVNKSLYKLERKNNLKNFILFSLIVGVLCFATIALFPMLKEVLNELAQESFGTVFEDMFRMDNIADYFTANMYQIWGLLGLIYASVLAVKLTSGNFKDGSYEMIYSLNISRAKIVSTKLVRLILNTTYFTIVVALFNFVALVVFAGFSGFSALNFLAYTLVMWLITLIMGVLSFALGLFSKHKFNTLSAVVLAMVFYIIVTLAEASMTDWIGYLSPLTIVASNVLGLGFNALKQNWFILVGFSAISVLMLTFSVIKFKNDDLC